MPNSIGNGDGDYLDTHSYWSPWYSERKPNLGDYIQARCYFAFMPGHRKVFEGIVIEMDGYVMRLMPEGPECEYWILVEWRKRIHPTLQYEQMLTETEKEIEHETN